MRNRAELRLTPKKIPRWTIAVGAFLSLCCGFGCPSITFFGSYPGSRIVSNLFDKPDPTLLEKTGLVLPEACEVRTFRYVEGFRGDGLTLIFDASKEESRAFMKQPPLDGALWERNEKSIFGERWRPGTPKPPYIEASLEPSARALLRVSVEERKSNVCTVRVSWSTD